MLKPDSSQILNVKLTWHTWFVYSTKSHSSSWLTADYRVLASKYCAPTKPSIVWILRIVFFFFFCRHNPPLVPIKMHQCSSRAIATGAMATLPPDSCLVPLKTKKNMIAWRESGKIAKQINRKTTTKTGKRLVTSWKTRITKTAGQLELTNSTEGQKVWQAGQFQVPSCSASWPSCWPALPADGSE